MIVYEHELKCVFNKRRGWIIKNKIKFYRGKKQLTQKQLAEKTGISERRLIELEKGEENLKLSTAFKIANILDTTVDELFLPQKKFNSKT